MESLTKGLLNDSNTHVSTTNAGKGQNMILKTTLALH